MEEMTARFVNIDHDTPVLLPPSLAALSPAIGQVGKAFVDAGYYSAAAVLTAEVGGGKESENPRNCPKACPHSTNQLIGRPDHRNSSCLVRRKPNVRLDFRENHGGGIPTNVIHKRPHARTLTQPPKTSSPTDR